MLPPRDGTLWLSSQGRVFAAGWGLIVEVSLLVCVSSLPSLHLDQNIKKMHFSRIEEVDTTPTLERLEPRAQILAILLTRQAFYWLLRFSSGF